jgi:hypothetical protein
MNADFSGYSKYTHSCWMRSTLVEAGLGQWLETPDSLTSIDFLPLGAGTFPRAAFLSFSTFLFLVRFLLVHS